jgi:DNA-binding FrmR family transcriptional regulator
MEKNNQGEIRFDKALGFAIIYPYLPPRYGDNKNKMMIENKKKKVLISLRKARTSLDKILDMVENDHYCISVMQQNLAVIGLLRSAHETLMSNHFNTCFKSAILSKNDKKRQEMTEEILKLINIYNK